MGMMFDEPKAKEADEKTQYKIINKNGLIIWDDYKSDFPGVVQYLKEIRNQYPIELVPNTPLVVYDLGKHA